MASTKIGLLAQTLIVEDLFQAFNGCFVLKH
jgi:hypothetical protein